jgi:hypothetical protein
MNDFREQFVNNPRGQRLNNTIRRFHVVEGLSDTDAFSKESETSIGNQLETISIESSAFHRLSCGHTILSPQEIGGECMRCSQTFCHRCGTRCNRCHDVLCAKDTKLFKEEALCRTCKTIRMTGTGIMGIFRGLHHLFSKEF